MGAIGRERTYVVKPDKRDLKLPTDLLGVTMLSYDNSRKSLRAATSILEIIETVKQPNDGPKGQCLKELAEID